MAAKLENFFSFQSFLINFNKTLTLNLKKYVKSFSQELITEQILV